MFKMYIYFYLDSYCIFFILNSHICVSTVDAGQRVGAVSYAESCLCTPTSG